MLKVYIAADITSCPQLNQTLRIMRKTLLLLTFITLNSICYSQVVKFKISSVSFKNYDEKIGQWEDWTEIEEVDILGTIDVDNDRIRIFSKSEQNYDVIENKGKRTDNDGDDIIEWICVNEDGMKCGVRLVTLNSRNGRKQLYVDFNNFYILYNIYFLD